MITRMRRCGLSTISDEEGVKNREQLVGLPPPSSSWSLASGEHSQSSGGETSKTSRDHTLGSDKDHRRRPLSLPPVGPSFQRAQALFKRTSLVFVRRSRVQIYSGIIYDSSPPDRPHLVQVNSMDRRRTAIGGPRPPVAGHSEDQRSQAFESIFGTPSAAHRDLQQRPTQRTLPTNPHQQPHYSQVYHQQQLNQPRFLSPQQPQTFSRSPQQYPYSPPNYSRPVLGYPPPSDYAVAPLQQSYQSVTQQRHVLSPGALLPPQQAQTVNHSVPPRLDSLLPEDGGKLSLDFMSEDGHGGVVVHAPEGDGLEDDSELPWTKTGQRTRKCASLTEK